MTHALYPHRNYAYSQADVFNHTPFAGNGLAVFTDATGLDATEMVRLANEMRQFESIFLQPGVDAATVAARIFTMEEELPFAGHPVLGAASVLHATRQPDAAEATWHLALPARIVTVHTERHPQWFTATMDQGHADFGAVAPPEYRTRVLAALNLTEANVPTTPPLQMVTTGLPYLIVPVHDGLERAHIVQPPIAELLGEVGARFVYVLDVARREGRTWNNTGLMEDSATGSAAGPAGAYLVRHGLARADETITLHQGRFVGRPSELHVHVTEAGNDLTVAVSGDVVLVGSGIIHVPTGA
jgi:trans-2,3-dihydro-3-hydroxyanthranilate isomerase